MTTSSVGSVTNSYKNMAKDYFVFLATIHAADTNIPYERVMMRLYDENKLISGTLRGNRADADTLVSKYYDEIYIFAYRQLGSKEDAMDMAQDIFVSVLETLAGYDRRKSTFRTWIYRVATNKIIDYRRKKRPATIPLDALELPSDFDKRLEQTAFIAEVENYIGKQDTEAQQVFRLHIYAGYAFHEIAVMLRQPESKLKARYYRLLTRLRKEFGNDVDTDAKPR